MNEQEQFDQLVRYIKQHLDQGIAEDNIRQVLLQHNWRGELIDRAFLTARPPSPIHQSPAASSHPEASQKYKVFQSIGDTFRTISKNPSTFVLAVVCSYAIAVVSYVLVSFIIGKVLLGEYGLLFASTSKVLTVLFGSLLLYTLWFAFAGALVLAATSLALPPSSENHKISIGAILSQSFTRIGRIIATDILFCVVSLWPIVLVIFLPFILLSGGTTGGGNASLLLFPVLLTAAIVWIYVALFRFALASYVALFEPDVPIFKTLSRSKHLLAKGGQWFLVKGFLLVLLVLTVLSLVTGHNLSELMDSANPAINIFIIVLTVLMNGALVMLYHNRKTVRG